MYEELRGIFRGIFRGLNDVADVRRLPDLYDRIESAAIELLEARRVLTEQSVIEIVDEELLRIHTDHHGFLKQFDGLLDKGDASNPFFDKV